MWHRTRLKKLKKGYVLDAYNNSPFIRQKMKYFLQVNDLYKVEEQKLRVNDSNVVGGKSEIQLSLRVSWKKEKNEFGDLILIVRIHKNGSVFRVKDRERNSKTTSNIWSDYFKGKFCKVL